MKPDPITKHEKEILEASRKLTELSKASNEDRRKIRLDPPIQRGWERNFVLTQQAENREDAETLRSILKHINTRAVNRRRDFCIRNRKTKKWIPQGQGLQRLSLWQWHYQKLESSWKKYFRYFPNSSRPWASFFDFKYPYLFRLDIRPNIIEFIYTYNLDLRDTADRIQDWLSQEKQSRRLQKMRGKSYMWKRYPRKARNDRHRTKQIIRKYIIEGKEIDLRGITPLLLRSISPPPLNES
ncbi:MAG: hypothetical protein AAF558_15225 [Verrucomicrobiota bacterium]